MIKIGRECHNDGIDFYKNENDECVKCECEDNETNNNDNLNGASVRKRRCQEITGKIFEIIMFK